MLHIIIYVLLTHHMRAVVCHRFCLIMSLCPWCKIIYNKLLLPYHFRLLYFFTFCLTSELYFSMKHLQFLVGYRVRLRLVCNVFFCFACSQCLQSPLIDACSNNIQMFNYESQKTYFEQLCSSFKPNNRFKENVICSVKRCYGYFLLAYQSRHFV